MSLSPFLRSPFTDLTGAMVSHQWYGQCADMELKVMDCLEAYGVDKGRKKCDTLIQDFQECASRKIRNQRIIEMRQERHRQYKAGERSKEDLYVPTIKTNGY
ncbi:hypothetical protein PPYR_02663 [Photinus pyralis]|uniref:Uncharacterized protein n=1 Tax=Photinus pyralis TaxID=7054 RepID=A0A1Y1KBU5_PHOPY|nr:uncharacterized protein LOC116174936 [Photinus pyralis]KAB0803520.1 hypothetical protein PPYR_00490 [Photinus pyralis]KAB0805693.1 hypothetical protein PPYR_02663 [Photinus pyralis]